MFVSDLRDAFRPQPVNLTTDPIQPPGYKGLAALGQGSVDLMEQVVGTFAYWNVAQDDLSILCLNRRQAARPVDYGRDRLDGG
jgi:hypothetical protein